MGEEAERYWCCVYGDNKHRCLEAKCPYFPNISWGICHYRVSLSDMESDGDQNIKVIRSVSDKIQWLWENDPDFKVMFDDKDIMHGADWAAALTSAANNIERKNQNNIKQFISLWEKFWVEISAIASSRDHMEREVEFYKGMYRSLKEPPTDAAGCDCHSVPGDSKNCKIHTMRDYHFYLKGLQSGKENIMERTLEFIEKHDAPDHLPIPNRCPRCKTVLYDVKNRRVCWKCGRIFSKEDE